MITCSDCSHLRRGQGGIKIGGRFSLEIVPPCPCAFYTRISDGNEFRLSDMATIYNGGFQYIMANEYRFCTVHGPKTRVRITDVECLNYDISTITGAITIRVYNYIPDGTCSPFGYPFSFIAESLFDFSTIAPACFNTFDAFTNSFYVEARCNVFMPSVVSPGPIFRVKVQFDHTGCP